MKAGKPKLAIVRADAPPPPRSAPIGRGHAIVYRQGEINRCPGCGRTHWHIGRGLAECAFCGTALPLSGVPQAG